MSTRNEQILTVLKDARTLIENEDQWTICAWARDAYGQMLVDPTSDRAVCFCAVGAAKRAIVKQNLRYLYKDILDCLDDAVTTVSKGWYVNMLTFNDASTHEDVLSAFDLAISRMQEKIKAPSEGEAQC